MERARYQPTPVIEAIKIIHFPKGSVVRVFPRGPGHEKPFLAQILSHIHHAGINNVAVEVAVVEKHEGKPRRIRVLGQGTSAIDIDQ